METKVKIGLLVEDFDLYPRNSVDEYHISQMVESLNAGKTLPPILAGRLAGSDTKSLIIVDGVHRKRAYHKVYGDKAKVPAIVKYYKSREELLLEAVQLNVAHGRSLTIQDKVRSIILLEQAKFELATIASTLNMTIDRVNELKVNRIATYKHEPIALKQTTGHFAGKQISKDQADYLAKAGGQHQAFYINQVIAMLEHNAVDWGSDNVVKRLKHLFDLLEKSLNLVKA